VIPATAKPKWNDFIRCCQYPVVGSAVRCFCTIVHHGLFPERPVVSYHCRCHKELPLKTAHVTPELSRKRSAEAYALRLKGMTYNEIGEKLGLTRQGATLACMRAERASLGLSKTEQASMRRQHLRLLTRMAAAHLWEWSRGSHRPELARLVLKLLRDIRVIAGIEPEAPYRRPVKPGERQAELDRFDQAVGSDVGVDDVAKTLRRIEMSVFGARKSSGPDAPLERFANAPRLD
jgi:predicted transcriptional regulator